MSKSFKKTNQFFLQKSEGFTLIELMVGMGIFILVVGTGSGILAYTIRTQNSLLVRQSIASEINFNVEYMSRALRMAVPDDGTCGFSGRVYDIGDSSLSFINRLQEDTCQEFFLQNGILYYVDRNGDTRRMSSPDTTIDVLEFKASGATAGDGTQPRITVLLQVSSPGLSNPLRLQTTVVSRKLDF